ASPALQGRPADHTLGQMAAPTDCSVCHTTANWNSSVMPAGHMPNPANQACSVCHTAIGSTLASYAILASIPVMHTGIVGGCGACHGGPSAALTFYNNNDNPKSAVLTPAHIPYLAGTDCGSCHRANYTSGGFGPTNMTQATHAFVSTSCDTCHEAGLSFYMGAASPALQGRPADHSSGQMAAPNDCSLCHNTANWSSTVLPTGHMPNPANQTCNVCHTSAPTDYTVLASISVLHTGITSGCSQCHGGSTQLTFYNGIDNPKAAVLTPPHIPVFTGTDCGSCHAPNYVTGGFGPMNMTQATHAGVGKTCDTCHEAGLTFYMGAASPGLQGRPADHTSGQMAAPNDCSECHTTANWNSTALPSGHMPNPASQPCSVCHTTAPNDYSTTTLAPNSVLHTGIAGGCGQCHGSPSGALTWYNNFTPKDAVLAPAHIPYLAGTDCGSCHTGGSYAPGSFGPMNMNQAKHAFVSTTCTTCHEAGVSFYMGAASPGLQGRPADHNSGQMAAPNDCSLCHTTANWDSTVLPAGHMPNPANQGCSVCHTSAPTDYSTATLAPKATLHTGISSGCMTCHGAPNSTPPVFYNNFTPKSAVLSPMHIPTSVTPCEDCHSPTMFTSFSGTTMNSAKHSAMFAVIGNTCDACHESTTPPLVFYGVNNLTTRPNDHHVGKDCSGCHNTSDWGGDAAGKPATANSGTRSKILMVVRPTSVRGAIGGAATAGATSLLAPGQKPTHVNTPRVGGPGTGSPGGSFPGRARTLAVAPPAGLAAPTHAGVTGNCASCHNGLLATGKPANHIQSNDSCENCHTTLAWIPATFDHRGLNVPHCVVCHNGVSAPGKPPIHVQTARDCGACHGTIAWRPANFDHLGVNIPCQICHNGVTATGKQIQHVITTQGCGSCHDTLSWKITKMVAPLRPLLLPRRGAHNGPRR
ncbi:MAG: hypothetical protein HKM03_04865, partial [Steroidobacteraceae bacterium]|nr:hypothetical protein [Steroidobacteraceae bacterium]